MKTLATFWRTEEAHLLRLRLEAAGIHAVLQDENITQIHPWRAAAIGGVRVQVAGEDFEAARTILADNDDLRTGGTPTPEAGVLECCACQAPIPADQTRCAACGWSYEDIPRLGE